jgi:hypothetical protein
MKVYKVQLEKKIFMTIKVEGPDDPTDDDTEAMENEALGKARMLCAYCSGFGSDADHPGIEDDNDWQISDDTWDDV